MAVISPTKWDIRSARDAFALGVLLFFVACVIGGATDEGSIAWATRVARALPIVPLCGAAAVFLVLRRAERRGEMLALESIGCSPARAALFVIASACALSVVAAIAVASVRGVTLDAFFPRATSPAEPRALADGSGAFVDDARGVHIDATGVMTRHAPTASAMPPQIESGRALSATLMLVALGLALALVAARAAKRVDARTGAAVGAMCVLCIFLVQASAASRAPAALVLLPASALLIFAVVRYREAAW